MIWLIVSEVSILGNLVTLFLGFGKALRHGRNDMVEKNAYLMTGSRERETGPKKGQREKYIPFKATVKWTCFV